MKTNPLILASSSPRRRELLSFAGVDFEVLPANLPEDISTVTDPRQLVKHLATEKAVAIGNQYPSRYILAADTVVALVKAHLDASPAPPHFGSCPVSTAITSFSILGKPKDENDARQMLQRLQGKAHWVYTAFTLCCVSKHYQVSRVVETQVSIRPLSPQEIEAYIATGEPSDKAGAYAIQGRGSALIKEIHGSLTNVIGLPLAEVLDELKICKLWTPKALNTSAFHSP